MSYLNIMVRSEKGVEKDFLGISKDYCPFSLNVNDRDTGQANSFHN